MGEGKEGMMLKVDPAYPRLLRPLPPQDQLDLYDEMRQEYLDGLDDRK